MNDTALEVNLPKIRKAKKHNTPTGKVTKVRVSKAKAEKVGKTPKVKTSKKTKPVKTPKISKTAKSKETRKTAAKTKPTAKPTTQKIAPLSASDVTNTVVTALGSAIGGKRSASVKLDVKSPKSVAENLATIASNEVVKVHSDSALRAQASAGVADPVVKAALGKGLNGPEVRGSIVVRLTNAIKKIVGDAQKAAARGTLTRADVSTAAESIKSAVSGKSKAAKAPKAKTQKSPKASKTTSGKGRKSRSSKRK